MYWERKEKNKKIFLFLLASAVLIFIFDYFRVLSPVRGFGEKNLVIPVRTFLSSLFLNSPTTGSKPVSEVCQDKDREILKLTEEIAVLKEENLASRKLLGAPLPANWQFLPARILGGRGEEIIIDKGSQQGVILEMPAIVEGIFLGRVSQVSQNLARINPVFSSDFRQVVKIISQETGLLAGKGLLSGRGKQKMLIEEILAENEIKEGDLTAVSLWEGDLTVGRINRINYQKGEVFKSAEVESELNLDKLQTIFLITGKI